MPSEGPAPDATSATLGELEAQKGVGRAVGVPEFELLQEVRKTAGPQQVESALRRVRINAWGQRSAGHI